MSRKEMGLMLIIAVFMGLYLGAFAAGALTVWANLPVPTWLGSTVGVALGVIATFVFGPRLVSSVSKPPK